MVVGGGFVADYQGLDRGQQLPIADLVRIDMIGIAVQHAVSQLGQLVV